MRLFFLLICLFGVDRAKGNFLQALNLKIEKPESGYTNSTFYNTTETSEAVGHPDHQHQHQLGLTDLENNLEYLNSNVKSLMESERGLEDDQTRLKSDVNFLYSALHGTATQQGKGSPREIFPGTGGDPFHQEVSDCGGIVVSDKGYIVHRSGENHTHKIICTWTLRANFEKNAVKLLSDNFDPDQARIVVMPLQQMLRRNLNYEKIMWFQQNLVAGDRNEYLFEGSAVFVTLITNATDDPQPRPSFVLSFEGKGDPSPSNVTFTHFHYTSYSGSMAYPNGPEYKDNEVATFVLSPPEVRGNMKVGLSYMDIQLCTLCSCDFFQRWDIQKNRNQFMHWGDENFDLRDCGTVGNILNNVAGTTESESWIVVFASDGSGRGKGFRFSWSSEV